MEVFLEYLIVYGYWILLAWVLLDQLALPLPAMPMILAAGGLAGEGHLDLGVCVAIVVVACMPANILCKLVTEIAQKPPELRFSEFTRVDLIE